MSFSNLPTVCVIPKKERNLPCPGGVRSTPVLAGVPHVLSGIHPSPTPSRTWGRILDWTSDRTRGTPPQERTKDWSTPRKELGPETEVPPTPVNRQSPVKT